MYGVEGDNDFTPGRGNDLVVGSGEPNPTYKLKPKQVELTAGEASTLKLKPKTCRQRRSPPP